MKKKALVAYYSHTGQLKEIILNFMENWKDEWDVDFMEITTNEYKFPINWTLMFDMMPESVLGIPCKISYTQYDFSNYDLVLLGFQPWYMHPSIPFHSFIKTTDFKKMVKDKPVYIITDCRNSRRNAIKIVADQVEASGGYIKGISVFWDDSSGNLIGAFTLFQWLFSGKKGKLLKLFPPAGVRPQYINEASLHGKMAMDELKDLESKGDYQTHVIPQKDVEFTSLGYEEYVIRKFRPWASYIIENKQRRKWRIIKFEVWILFTIIFIAPFVSAKNRKKREV